MKTSQQRFLALDRFHNDRHLDYDRPHSYVEYDRESWCSIHSASGFIVGLLRAG